MNSRSQTADEPAPRKPKPHNHPKPRPEMTRRIELTRTWLEKLHSKFRSFPPDLRLEKRISNQPREIARLQDLRDPPAELIFSHFNGNAVTYRINGRGDPSPKIFQDKVRPLLSQIMRTQIRRLDAMRSQTRM